MSSMSSDSSEGLEGAVTAALQVVMEEEILKLEAELEASFRKLRCRWRYMRLDREDAHERLHRDYFAADSIHR